MKSEFRTKLQVEEVCEIDGLWKLLAPLRYFSELLAREISVPADFQTDFASVPRLPFVYLAAGGRGDRAAVVHDWLYTTQLVERAQADQVLREALLACGYSEGLAGTFYAAVRLFGGSHWKQPNVPQAPHVQVLMTGGTAPA